MPIFKKIPLSTITIALLVASCNKHRLDIVQRNQRATEFNKMQVSSDFNWSTYQKIQFKYTPNLQANSIGIVAIKDVKGNILFSKNHDLSKHFDVDVLVPIHETRLVVQVGNQIVTKSLAPNSKLINITP